MRSREIAKAVKSALPQSKTLNLGDQLEVRSLMGIDREDCEKGGCTVIFSVLITKYKLDVEFSVDGFTEEGLRKEKKILPPKCRECMMEVLQTWKEKVLESL